MSEYKGIWVFAECRDGKITATPFELLSKAVELKAKLNGDVTAVLLGENTDSEAKRLLSHGADQVIILNDHNLTQYRVRPYAAALSALIAKHKPLLMMFGSTTMGRELAPYLMVKLHTGLVADAVAIDVDEDNDIIMATPGYGGSLLAHICIKENRTQMVTVRPKVFVPLQEKENPSGKILTETVKTEDESDWELLETIPAENGDSTLSNAKIVVAAGRGVGTAEHIEEVRELAELLHGCLGCSRPLVETNLLNHELQIGQSGCTVRADFILNVGISGATQYLSGMQNSECIVSINQNKKAGIFDISHYGMVADCTALVPAVIAEIKRRKSQEAT